MKQVLLVSPCPDTPASWGMDMLFTRAFEGNGLESHHPMFQRVLYAVCNSGDLKSNERSTSQQRYFVLGSIFSIATARSTYSRGPAMLRFLSLVSKKNIVITFLKWALREALGQHGNFKGHSIETDTAPEACGRFIYQLS